jgi:hypothetical protein
MKRFSEREGFKPVKSVIQVDSMDIELRNSLWNALTIYYWRRKKQDYDGILLSANLETLINQLRIHFFKIPIDNLQIHWGSVFQKLKEHFSSCKWCEVYDFIEFIAKAYPDNSVNLEFMNYCNSVLEQELSAYRFVGGKITKITSKEEIAEIEEAQKTTGIEQLKPVNIHLKSALDLFADRKSPDYRNCIKESISAVEATCKLIANNPKATLGDAIKEVKKKVDIHPALEKAFDSLYGYTSNAEGIRHALLDKPKLDFEDAKFMVVSCSAFINYLISKSSKAGLSLDKMT